jgi:O-antigen ligase
MSELIALSHPEVPDGFSAAVAHLQMRREATVKWLLVLLLVIGAAVALADGLTRAPNADWESMPFQNPLQYTPYKAAFLFAGLLIPLTLRYARGLGASLLHGLLLWFVMCTAAYSKDFAYLRLPGVPLFITDVILALLFLFIFLCPRVRIPTLQFWPVSAALLLVSIGILEVCRGLAAGRDALTVLRDFEVPLYAVFLLIGMYAVEEWPAIQRFCRFFIYGALMASLTAVGWFLMVPAQRRYIFHGGPHIAAAFIGVLAWTLSKRVPATIRYGVIGLLAVGIILTNSRTAYVCIAVCLGVLFLTAKVGNRHLRFSGIALLLGGTILISGILLTLMTVNDKGSAFLSRTTRELISGTVNYQNDANAEFRFQAWNEAMNRFSQNPLFGEGFGVPFLFGDEDYDSRPHNTYLTVLYKMGLAGFVPLMCLFGHFFLQGWKALRSCRKQQESLLLYCCMLAFLSMFLSGALNLALESPFAASIFWLTMGVCYRMMILLARQQRLLQMSFLMTATQKNHAIVPSVSAALY